jgi:hypothetical protein
MAVLKLSKEKVRNLRALWQSGQYTHEQIAKKYKISRGHATKVINGKRWNKENYPDI